MLAPLFILMLGAAVPEAAAEGGGSISGTIIDAKTRDPLAFASVALVGTQSGAISRGDGSFYIADVPPGTHSVRATYMGYATRTIEKVSVEPGKTSIVRIELLKTVLVGKEVEVTAERPMVEIKNPGTLRRIRAEDLENKPVQNMQEVLAQQAGVVESDGDLHIRGGRADETLFIVDGVKMRDPISGSPLLGAVDPRSVAEMSVLTGGFDAEYGQAMSGVVEVTLNEGGARQKRSLYYSADHSPFHAGARGFGSDDVQVSLGGPDPVVGPALRSLGINLPGYLTYFGQLSAFLTDTYLPNISGLNKRLESGYRDSFLGLHWGYDNLAPREQNDWKGVFKLVWQASNNKLSFTSTKSLSIDQGFFTSNPYDVQHDQTQYPWAWSRRLDHYPTSIRDNNSAALTWTRTLSANTIQRLSLSRSFNCVHEDVAGKPWWMYEEPLDSGRGLPASQDTPYFYDTGDGDTWADRWSKTWSAAWDLTHRLPPHHELKTGLEASLENIQYVVIQDPYYTPQLPYGVELTDDQLQELRKNSLGYSHDIFHVYPSTGAVYVRDKYDFEGLAGSVGLRYDLWFPSDQVTDAVRDPNRGWITDETRAQYWKDTRRFFLFGDHRFKSHLSPRLGVSHPITDRDNLFFNYGHFSQWPSYIWVFSKLSSISSESYPFVGNPNLNPEISVQYELGARHQFTETLAADLTLFYKDIYDYPTAVTFEKLGVGQFEMYMNQDYARSRGIELEIKKRRAEYFSGSLGYTYSIATGKSSDPNEAKLIQQAGGSIGTYEPPLWESYLWWNRPHKLNASLDFQVPATGTPPSIMKMRLPRDCGAEIEWTLESGRAYTRQDGLGADVGRLYAANGPYDSIVNLRLYKTFRPGGPPLKTFLQIRNLFDRRSVLRFDYETGQPYALGAGQYGSAWLSRTRNDASAYQTGLSTMSNPSYLGEPRNASLGMVLEW